MIIIDDFVFLNLPKTGSTFVRNVLKKIYYNRENVLQKIRRKLNLRNPELLELLLPNIKMPNRKPDQHGTYSQIPEKYLTRQIVSVVRNPFDRFSSLYRFRAWASDDQLAVSKQVIYNRFPHFPNLTIDEFVDYCIFDEISRLKILGVDSKENEIGCQTLQFIQMFFKNPKEVLMKLNDEYIFSGSYKQDIGKIKYLRQENLNDDLYDLLKNHDYSTEELNFIKSHRKLNVTLNLEQDKGNLMTPKAINYVKNREKYLLKILKDFNIDYTF